MSLVDKLLECLDFGTDFTFSTEWQEFFATKEYTNESKRVVPHTAEPTKHSALTMAATRHGIRSSAYDTRYRT